MNLHRYTADTSLPFLQQEDLEPSSRRYQLIKHSEIHKLSTRPQAEIVMAPSSALIPKASTIHFYPLVHLRFASL